MHFRQASKIRNKIQNELYEDLVRAYPQAQTIYVAQDNWPNHAAPGVLAPLQAQRTPFYPNAFRNWSTAERYTTPPNALPIQLNCLSTYAPWTNPIEKLWRWLCQDILHLHRFSHRWSALKQRVADFYPHLLRGQPNSYTMLGYYPINWESIRRFFCSQRNFVAKHQLLLNSHKEAQSSSQRWNELYIAPPREIQAWCKVVGRLWNRWAGCAYSHFFSRCLSRSTTTPLHSA